jgi:predicted CxxxxCH...CXXCH cytochrome family protein
MATRARALWLASTLAAVAGCDDPRAFPPGGDPCQRCHGGVAGNAAPPRTIGGAADDPAVGAHQAHLRGGAIAGPIACGECHLVPTSTRDHAGSAIPVFPGPLAGAGEGANPVYAPATGTCSGTYCHGATLGAGGGLTAPVWTATDGAAVACGACHASPPPLPHPQVAACAGCHGETVDENGDILVAGGKHVNGQPDVAGDIGCGACHEIPPDTGAHRVHYGLGGSPPAAAYGDLLVLEDYLPEGGPSYAFGCGHCHPIDPARHGYREVVLSPEGAPAGTLKARNAADAAYDRATGTCSGVYCHSAGKAGPLLQLQADGSTAEGPIFRATPAWTSGASLGCAGCHDNPPRYVSGGAGGADANTHLQLDSDGWETGHFGGLPGPWHWGPKHGRYYWGPDEDGSPLTCQGCHYDTTDPAGAGPSGFYWLNTTGDYQLPTGSFGYSCTSCHVADDPVVPTGSGGVLPLRHVNGRPDVVFDPRQALPALSWLPAAPYTPTRPIWITDANPAVDAPADGVFIPAYGGTLAMHLSSAAYDPADKTCTNVSCHLAQTTVTWGGPTGWAVCGECHAMAY